jgi:hypothetical protein
MRAILIATALFVMQTSFAQHLEKKEAHWKIRTDPNTRSTTVDFFDEQQHIIYKEILLNKYLKVNEKNVRKLDELLALMLSKRFVETSIKTNELNAPCRLNPPIAPSTNRSFHCTAFVHQQELSTCLTIIVDNPARKKLTVRLTNQKGNPMYKRHNGLDISTTHVVTLSRYSLGSYLIQVSDGLQTFNREIQVSNRGVSFSDSEQLPMDSTHPPLVKR